MSRTCVYMAQPRLCKVSCFIGLVWLVTIRGVIKGIRVARLLLLRVLRRGQTVGKAIWIISLFTVAMAVRVVGVVGAPKITRRS